MKVRVSWGARITNAAFKVKAADLEAVVRFLDARSEWGRFDHSFRYKWEGDSQGNVTSVTVTPAFTITMPRWPAYRDQAQTCKDAWDAMYRALRTHEDGHREIFEKGIATFTGKLEELKGTTKSSLEKFMDDWKVRLQSEQDKYDTETEHGKARGVELVITEPCKSKPKRD
jgi:predicted secreted Zn-dependent protease